MASKAAENVTTCHVIDCLLEWCLHCRSISPRICTLCYQAFVIKLFIIYYWQLTNWQLMKTIWKSYVSYVYYCRQNMMRNVYWFVNYDKCNTSGGRFKNTYELLNLRALKISMLYKNHIFQCMGKIFCVEFQRVPLKFHTKYLIHTLKDVDFILIWQFKSS